MQKNPFWFPLKVKNNKEVNVLNKLLKNGYKAYLPLERYSIQKGERVFWKLRPVFKGKLFINCSFLDLDKICSENADVKFYGKAGNQEFLQEGEINFLKKALASTQNLVLTSKDLDTTVFLNIQNEEYGDITIFSCEYKEEDFYVWKIPVININLLIESDNNFMKYLVLDFQESIA